MKVPVYTSVFCTANVANGSTWPSIMFTTDPGFDLKGKSKYPDLEQRMFQRGIAEWQICFIGTNEWYEDGKAPNFVGEHKEFTEEAVKRWGVIIREPEKMVVFTDNGSAFKKDSGSLLEQLGFGKHIYFPSVCHQILSTQDNGSLPQAKRAWRKADRDNFIPYTDEPHSSLFLMNQVDKYRRDEVEGWWTKNFLLDFTNLDAIDIAFLKTRFGEKCSQWTDYHGECTEAFKIFSTPIPPGGLGRPMKQKIRFKYTGHNGVKWTSPGTRQTANSRKKKS